MHRTVGIAVGCMIGAGESVYRIGHVGVGIEQAGGAAAITHGAGGAESDLHHAVIALADGARSTAALALDDAADQILRDMVGGGMARDQRVELAVGIKAGEPLVLGESDRYGDKRGQNRGKAKFANHVSSGFFW